MSWHCSFSTKKIWHVSEQPTLVLTTDKYLCLLKQSLLTYKSWQLDRAFILEYCFSFLLITPVGVLFRSTANSEVASTCVISIANFVSVGNEILPRQLCFQGPAILFACPHLQEQEEGAPQPLVDCYFLLVPAYQCIYHAFAILNRG